MIIRKAEYKDLPEINSIEELCFPEDTAFPVHMLAYLIRYAETLVADQTNIEGFIIGHVSEGVGSIYTLDVHPSHRRKGIGHLLIQMLEDILQAKGAKKIRLEVAGNNVAALSLYRKAGYIEGEIIKNYYGGEKHAVRMYKNLNQSFDFV
ncbi:MAG: GNAT family N-acetyltransferase [Methanotrichaceae archaeon]|nr:GNAT family N-acetyltransferase [Methanotrichaceae archaeon]